MLAIRLPEEIEQRLTALAEATGRTKTFYAREAILEHLDDIEDAYLGELAYERHKNQSGKTYSLAQVEQELGLAD
jgi:RHH-type rel operon transcriptional repressor/antitoxin RelB